MLQPKPLDPNATVSSMERMLRCVLAGGVVLRAALQHRFGMLVPGRYVTLAVRDTEILVESGPDRGTEFRVYLPAYAGTAAERRSTPASGLPITAGQVRTVLVVDDDDAVRDVAVRALAHAGS